MVAVAGMRVGVEFAAAIGADSIVGMHAERRDSVNVIIRMRFNSFSPPTYYGKGKKKRTC